MKHTVVQSPAHKGAFWLKKTTNLYFLSLWWKRSGDNRTEQRKEAGTETRKVVASDGEEWKVAQLVSGSVMKHCLWLRALLSSFNHHHLEYLCIHSSSCACVPSPNWTFVLSFGLEPLGYLVYSSHLRTTAKLFALGFVFFLFISLWFSPFFPLIPSSWSESTFIHPTHL